MKNIAICESDGFARKTIEAVLAAEGLTGHCQVVPPQEAAAYKICLQIDPDGKVAAPNADQFKKPLRIGALMDRVRWHLSLNAQKAEACALAVGPYELDRRENSLRRRKTGEIIRLTDKEKQILECLIIANGEIVERRALLDQVWGYAENVETHTLETHIYRLRQKIEQDPAAPKILLTEEQGYRMDHTHGGV